MVHADKPVVWLHGEIKTPPFSPGARVEAGVLLRRLQRGERLSLPASRPMPIVGRRCHELRIVDADQTWRIIYRLDPDAVVIAEVFSKKTTTTPTTVIDSSRTRLRHYDDTVRD
ncbi:MAG: type II toxin-antitoxin system RelE/ParE family toxin [Vicinamibacterales bacterium]